MKEALEELAARVERVRGDDKSLNREVALAVGWHRYSPSEIGKSNPGWIAPEDFIGEYTGKDGRRTPKLDSLHGTSIWREPRNYLLSLDAAIMLGLDRATGFSINADKGLNQALIFRDGDGVIGRGDASTPALAFLAAALRAITSKQQESE